MATPKQINPDRSIGYQLGRTLRSLRCFMDKRQTPLGLTRNEWLVICALLKSTTGCINQCELRNEIGIEDSYLTKVLDKLIDKNIIKKVICSDDRRQRKLTIDPASKPFIDKVSKEISQANKLFLQGFSQDETELLFSFLERIRENIPKPL